MHIVPTKQNEYQLVGATCFFISSKLKETVPIALRKVTEYTANSLTEQDVLVRLFFSSTYTSGQRTYSVYITHVGPDLHYPGRFCRSCG